MGAYVDELRQRAGRQMPFVGRQSELAVFDSLLTSRGRPVVVEVAGEPGIGKTRLLSELATIAEQRGATVAAGRATEYERALPFGLFQDALDDLLGPPRPAAVEDLIGRDGGPLQMIFPAVRGSGAEAPGSGDRWHVYRAAAALLAALAAERDLVMILDDVHWADTSSAELLRYLLDHGTLRRVVLVVAHRPRQLAPQIASALQCARPSGTVTRLELAPLNQHDVDAILGPELRPGHRARLYRQSGGNPFYLEAIRDRPVASPPEPTGSATPPEAPRLPWAVRVALRAEIDMLGEFPFLVARAAAVTGDPVSPALTAAVAELPAEVVLACIDVLVQRDILRPAGPGGRFTFRHPVVRQTIYESAGAGWRLGAHERAAAALAAIGSSLPQRAQHVERYAQPGDDGAIELLVAAAEAVQGHSPAVAAHWLEVALATVPHGSDERRIPLLGQLAFALGLSGEYARSRDQLTELLELLPDGAPGRTVAVRICAVLCRLLGDTDYARALLQAELASVGPADPDAGALMLELAHVHLTERPDGDGLQHAVTAYQLAHASGGRAQLSYAASTLALARGKVGDIDSANRKIDEAVEAIAGLPDGDLFGHLELFIVLGWACFLVERSREGIGQLGRGLSLVRVSGQDYLLAPLLTLLTHAHLALGDLAQARTSADQAAEAAMISGTPGYRMLALVGQSMVALSAGAVDAAVALADEARRQADDVTEVFARQASQQLAFALIAEGRRAGQGLELMLRSGDGEELPNVDAYYRSRAHEALVCGYLQLNDVARAWAHAQRAGDSAACVPLHGSRGYARLALARVMAADEPAVAAQHADAAATCFDQSGDLLEAARSRRLAADIREHPGDTARAAEAYSSRVSETAHGIAPRSEPASGGIADGAAGRRTGPGTPAPLATLSPRQLEVARLVAEAQTNRQIARSLGIVERTVEVHISQILRRLGLASRAAIASAVTRADVTDSLPRG